MLLDGLCIHGPVQSRPEWEAQVLAADRASRAAWSAYAGTLLDNSPISQATPIEHEPSAIV